MATRYVDPGSTIGGDGTTTALSGATRAFSSLSEWEAARQGVLSEIEECLCRNTTAVADTSNTVIDGWTTTSSFYPDIKADAGQIHAGTWTTSKYYIDANGGGGSAVQVVEDYTRIMGLQININSFSANILSIGNIGNVRVSRCIIKATVASSVALHLNSAAAQPHFFWNNLLYDCAVGFRHSGSGADFYLYSNTVQNCSTTGIEANAGITDCIARNNVVQDCGTCYTGNFVSPDSTNNCSDDGTQPGSSGQNGEVTFVNEASDDFHLAAGDTVAQGNGADLSAAAGIAFSDDIDGDTRDASWDIGADAIVSASTRFFLLVR